MMLLSRSNNRLASLKIQFISTASKDQLIDYTYFQMILYPIFLLIFTCNLISTIPYSFANSAQFITSFSLSVSIFISIIIIGLLFNGNSFFSLFLPSGVPIILAPLLISIEILSFFSRVISLAVRLSANIISGHTLMDMIAIGISSLFHTHILLISVFPIPFLILFALSIVEIGISALQAYVFVLLSLSYLHDSIYLH